MRPISESPSNISLTSGQDTTQSYTIHRAEVNKPYQTIGSYLSPTGNMDKEIEVKEEAITKWGTPSKQAEFTPT